MESLRLVKDPESKEETVFQKRVYIPVIPIPMNDIQNPNVRIRCSYHSKRHGLNKYVSYE